PGGRFGSNFICRLACFAPPPGTKDAGSCSHKGFVPPKDDKAHPSNPRCRVAEVIVMFYRDDIAMTFYCDDLAFAHQKLAESTRKPYIGGGEDMTALSSHTHSVDAVAEAPFEIPA